MVASRKNWKNHSEVTAFNNISNSSIKESPALTLHTKDQNAIKKRKNVKLQKKFPMKSNALWKISSKSNLFNENLLKECLDCLDWLTIQAVSLFLGKGSGTLGPLESTKTGLRSVRPFLHNPSSTQDTHDDIRNIGSNRPYLASGNARRDAR